MSKLLYRYVGPGQFPGVPKKDLTEDEFNALPVHARLDVAAGTLYEAADGESLQEKTAEELRGRARDLGVSGFSAMTKDALVSAVKAVEAADTPEGDEE